jgi:erythronate-4-phosphate dehydrogenase
MKIIADENIPCVEALLAPFGEVTLVRGRELSAQQLIGADVLLVRSVTPVNEELLAQSSVKFVGTATIGTDHIDTDFLRQKGIEFASAPGSNAGSVVQYVLSAMSVLRPDWLSLQVGIIGCGNVGGLLYRKLASLGVDCCGYDPFLSSYLSPYLSQSEQSEFALVSLEDVLRCDIVCLHTPLTTDGQYPTYHMLGEAQLQQLKPGAMLLNAGRGSAVDQQALLKLLPENRWQVALDVWENEPELSRELLKSIALGTPHIAGHSVDGKLNGTLMLREAFCQWLNIDEPVVDTAALMDKPETFPVLRVNNLNEAILACYDVRDDDRRMRTSLLADNVKVAEAFDGLRKQYPRHFDFHHYVCDTTDEELRQLLAVLGFQSGDGFT